MSIAEAHFSGVGKLSVLDVGCGVGLTDRFLVGKFGALHGVDICEDAIGAASSSNPTAHYQCYDGTVLPYSENTFDIAFAICVMHHVPQRQWLNFLVQMRRVVKPSGLIVLFEHNPWNPITRLVVGRCEFDDGAVLVSYRKLVGLFHQGGLDLIDKRFILFFPLQAPFVDRMERMMAWLPLGAQYFVVGRKCGY